MIYRAMLLSGALMLGILAPPAFGQTSDQPAAPSPEVAQPAGQIGSLVQAIESAADPSQVVAAYARSSAAGYGTNPELLSAYVNKMITFGLPDAAYIQAQTLVDVDPKNGVAWGVLSYMAARQGQMAEALADLAQAGNRAPDDKFIQATAGQLLAWYDMNKPTVSDSLKNSLDKVRKMMSSQKAFKDAYQQAQQDLKKTGAAQPPPTGPKYASTDQLWPPPQMIYPSNYAYTPLPVEYQGGYVGLGYGYGYGGYPYAPYGLGLGYAYSPYSYLGYGYSPYSYLGYGYGSYPYYYGYYPATGTFGPYGYGYGYPYAYPFGLYYPTYQPFYAQPYFWDYGFWPYGPFYGGNRFFFGGKERYKINAADLLRRALYGERFEHGKGPFGHGKEFGHGTEFGHNRAFGASRFAARTEGQTFGLQASRQHSLFAAGRGGERGQAPAIFRSGERTNLTFRQPISRLNTGRAYTFSNRTGTRTNAFSARSLPGTTGRALAGREGVYRGGIFGRGLTSPSVGRTEALRGGRLEITPRTYTNRGLSATPRTWSAPRSSFTPRSYSAGPYGGRQAFTPRSYSYGRSMSGYRAPMRSYSGFNRAYGGGFRSSPAIRSGGGFRSGFGGGAIRSGGGFRGGGGGFHGGGMRGTGHR